MISFSKVYNNDPRERACFSFSTFAIVLFLFLGVFVSPPKIENLTISQAKIIGIELVHGGEIVKFADENGQILECLSQARGWKCPLPELNIAHHNNDTLVLWHDHKTIYQIKSADKLLLAYSKWRRESNIAYAVALFWMVLLLVRLTPLFIALIKQRINRLSTKQTK